jgi:hypothetical protein
MEPPFLLMRRSKILRIIPQAGWFYKQIKNWPLKAASFFT